MSTDVLFSIITPSRGDRPKALFKAIQSVQAALQTARRIVPPERVEMLVGFDGVKGERVSDAGFVRYFDLPRDGNYGNAIRNTLLKAAGGSRVLFLDDDNALTPNALLSYSAHPDTEMVVGRIDVSRTLSIPWLPQITEGEEPILHCNIDPLCLCLDIDLVVERCGGWHGDKYESDFQNILTYSRRARSIVYLEEFVGVYDAGLGLDEKGVGVMQRSRLHHKSES